ncbi:histidine--tRNA ligase [Tumebacillus lipolyticus]|uniref:Histidine--tRNA ligase n=1 Tax=Tumebacillus lipolyticus TaxID=1280370 RepID=A0ABW5A1F5_9BACL
MERINRPRGTADLLPRQARDWQKLEQIAREVCAHFHVQEIRTPMFEHTELFLRGVGDGTDIVEKEMYTFLDKGGRSLTLRPEGTAPVARAVLENKLYAEMLPLKLSYIAPMFRYERPGVGRLRQHHQFGVEMVGSLSPAAEVEMIALIMSFYGAIGAKELTVALNSVGCASCRSQYREALLDYLELRLTGMCEDCNRRAKKNPLRILDCKNSCCQAALLGAPSIQDCLCEECQTHFAGVVQGLEALGLPCEIDARLVRGIDYYTRTVFEVMTASRSTVAAGGRYNSLYAELGEIELPAVGFGIGLERALLLLEEQGAPALGGEDRVDLYLIPLGDRAEIAVLPLLQELRQAGLVVERDFAGKGLKSALKRADRLQATYALIAGDEELAAGKLLVKELATGTQERMTLEELLYRIEG